MTACRGCGGPLPPRKRLWCSERCRRRQYDLRCVDCGGRVCGTTPSREPKRCVSCSRARQHATRYWTRERVIAALRAYADAHDGRPPSGNPRRHPPGVPPTSMAQREFGSWTAAVRAANLPLLRPR